MGWCTCLANSIHPGTRSSQTAPKWKMSSNCSPQNRVLGQGAVPGSRSVQKVIWGMKSEQSTWGSLGCDEGHSEDHEVHRTAFGSQTHKEMDMKGNRWTHYSVIPSCPPHSLYVLPPTSPLLLWVLQHLVSRNKAGMWCRCTVSKSHAGHCPQTLCNMVPT